MRSMHLLRRKLQDFRVTKETPTTLRLLNCRHSSTEKDAEKFTTIPPENAEVPAISSASKPQIVANTVDAPPVKKVKKKSLYGSSTKEDNFAPRDPNAPKPDYTTDYFVARKFTDVNVMRVEGRVYSQETTLLSADTAITFPKIYGSSMNGVDKQIPHYSSADAKLVCFSIKEYGFQLVREWIDPFARRFNPIRNENKDGEALEKQAPLEVCKRVSCHEIIFVEYSLLWYTRSVFAKATKLKIMKEQHDHTFLSFGSITVNAHIMLCTTCCDCLLSKSKQNSTFRDVIFLTHI